MDNTKAGTRRVDLRLSVEVTEKSRLFVATSEDMPNLKVIGTDENDLWECLSPVVNSLFEAGGERVQAITLDRTGGLAAIRITAELAPAE